MWAHTKESQNRITPEQALLYLKEGNGRFVSNLRLDRNHLMQLNQTSDGQFPFATILSCIDSRTSAELIFDQGLGDIFSIRIAGNVINEDILGSMEYACNQAGAKIVVVLGHTKCGAIVSACDKVEAGHLTGLLHKIKPAIEREDTVSFDRTGQNMSFVTKVSILNVRMVMAQILEQSSILHKMVEEKIIVMVGGIYDIDSGVVTFLDEPVIS